MAAVKQEEIEEDDEINASESQSQEKNQKRKAEEIKVFIGVRRQKRVNQKRSHEEISFFVEKVMAELEIAVEDDVQLNKDGKPAIKKLQKLPFMRDVLCKKRLQSFFLNHGILTLLKNWLEPLPDGSLPNCNVRTEILNILTDFPLHLNQLYQRQQLKKSGLGKAVMFLIIFDKNESYSDVRNSDYIQVPVERKALSRPEFRGCDLDFNVKNIQKHTKSSQGAMRPEPAALVYKVRPKSNWKPVTQPVLDESRERILKRLRVSKKSNKRTRGHCKLKSLVPRVVKCSYFDIKQCNISTK
ncbi:hypothetical protein CCACVL1_29491 [Corchorus capsularis]|uniref:TFIIS N-terminal domain-containing protein n=1 Tax=Corchorus capsularis TaxID=210143 RepID=A0A1R3G1J9_COCAP|nr:hypothetical protein CCACVL1_29491 [Corchorus capsularis]